MMPVTVVTLGVYLAVFVVESALTEKIQFGSNFAWAGNTLRPALIKFFVKLVLTCGFVFDKAALQKPGFLYASFALLCISLHYKFKGAKFYNRWVNAMSNFYDVILAYLIFFVGVHVMLDLRFQITDLLVFIWTGMIVFALYSILFVLRNRQQTHSIKTLQTASSHRSELIK